MKIDRELIRHLERLSKIDLAPGEVELVTEQLGRIMEFVTKLQAADTTGVETTRVIDHCGGGRLREDVTREGLERDEVANLAPVFRNGFFVVPRVLEKGGK